MKHEDLVATILLFILTAALLRMCGVVSRLSSLVYTCRERNTCIIMLIVIKKNKPSATLLAYIVEVSFKFLIIIQTAALKRFSV